MATPVTTPVEDIVATDGVALLHVPPPTDDESVDVRPTPTVVVPDMVPVDVPVVTEIIRQL